MSTKSDASAENFLSGFNCAQAVFTAFCEKYGLNFETAAKLAGGMGGGFRFGQICGAASGGVLVIGLRHGASDPADKTSKAACNEKTKAFLEEFRKRNQSFICREILGCDISTPEGQAKAAPQFTTTCVDMVKSAVELLEELGY